MDPASMAKQSDLNPPEKSKTPQNTNINFNQRAASKHLLWEY